jgi:hypothetical protein
MQKYNVWRNKMMKKINQLWFAVILFAANANAVSEIPNHVQWTVVGAGPTGIMALQIIKHSGIADDQIAWVDPEFNVGRMGKYYKNVPGNGTVRQYLELMNVYNPNDEVSSQAIDLLKTLPLDHSPKLKRLVNPLQDITNHLCSKVIAIQDTMIGLDFIHDQWHIKTNAHHIISENLVLATGARPRLLHYEGVSLIPLDVALDKAQLAHEVTTQDTVAVIGSGHSALLIVKHLAELAVHRVVNFYNKPIVYPTPMRNGIAWQEAGLKGKLATWTKTVLEVNPPANIIRVKSTPEEIQNWLPHCTKVIYAIGFERNDLPVINGSQALYANYDRTSGMIGPRCFGVGIAFPVEKADALGNVEELVGLPYLKFTALQEALNQAK